MDKKNNEYISVIMPVYNAGEFLVESIESIRGQTFTNWEMIIVDDGSTDNSPKILKQFAKKDNRIKVFYLSKNKGLAFSLNYALRKAQGKYLARMDADDISLPQRFEKQMTYLEKNPKLAAIGSQLELINEKGEVIGYKTFPTDPKELYKMMLEMVAIQHPTLFTYTKFMKRCRYENHTTAEDVSMMFRLLNFGGFTNTKEVFFKYRIREKSNSLINPKKTFYLTLKSRIKAIRKFGYKPTVRGIFINIAEGFVVAILPKKMMIDLYKKVRFQKQPFGVYMSQYFFNLLMTVTKGQLSFLKRS